MKKYLGHLIFLLFFVVFPLKPYCIRVTVLKNKNTNQKAVFFHDIHLRVNLPQLERINETISYLDQFGLRGGNVLVEAHKGLDSIEELSKIRREVEKTLLGVNEKLSCETSLFSEQTLPFVSRIKTKNLAIRNIDNRGYLASAMCAMKLVLLINSINTGNEKRKLFLKNSNLSKYSLEKCCQNLQNLNDRIKKISKRLPDSISFLCKDSLSVSEKFVTDVRKKLKDFLKVSFSDFDAKTISIVTPILLPFYSLLSPLLDYNIVGSKALNAGANYTTLIFAGATHCDNVEEMLEKGFGWKKIYDSGVLINGTKYEGKTQKLVYDWACEYSFFKRSNPDLTPLNYQIQEAKKVSVDHLFKKNADWLKIIKS